ncbi:hypothetical protein [Halapricum desulfuricans]|uniref:C2H2-type domain-containing protein n=1 Tax=Halapricum desulfuricans TaxID=2841257 RepID=A0A897NB06_9EURY|nr:hypothetical protein [Halapricum desulfuricans]QSG09588.1 Uncharacterized protein HSR122_2207 [Halapricum desulfuricans]
MSELKIGGSKITVELNGNTIEAKANTGNKQWVSVITETHECDGCGDEFDTEHGLATHEGLTHSNDGPSSTDESDGHTAEVVADGGTEEIRDLRDVRNSDDEVRRYSADGHLYAYREGDEHVIVARGDEPRMRWTKRVPAERGAVLEGEQLWTIPDNWEKRATIKGEAEARYGIYNIPETDVDVLATIPNNNYLVDAWYGIENVGQLEVTYDDRIEWDKLEQTIENVKEIDEVGDDVVDALKSLHRRKDHFERKFAEDINLHAQEAVFGGSLTHEPISLEGWTLDPWLDTADNDYLIGRFLDVEDETLDGVMTELKEARIIPPYPEVRVDVDSDVSMPDGYEIRAICEAGASGAEAVDYIMTEQFDAMNQTEWADIRGKTPSAISKNVGNAEDELLK